MINQSSYNSALRTAAIETGQFQCFDIIHMCVSMLRGGRGTITSMYTTLISSGYQAFIFVSPLEPGYEARHCYASYNMYNVVYHHGEGFIQ